MTPRLYAACARAVHVVTPDGRELRAGDAVTRVIEGLGWRWAARVLGARPMRWAVAGGYWLVARNRARLSRLG